MSSLDNGTLIIKANRLDETEDHVSRLSMRTVIKGNQYYKVGGNEHVINTNNFLLINQGQSYKTAFASKEENEILIVAFKPTFAESLLHSLITPEDRLLDNPYDSTQPVLFYEKTYESDPVIAARINSLMEIANTELAIRKESDMDSIYTDILTRLLFLHRKVNGEIARFDSIKKSTGVELYRRLYIARDYMDAHACERLTLNDIAKRACLSVHHFKRSFTSLFGITPHKYLIQKRLQSAEALLLNSAMPVQDICTATGFENTSSFIRLFRIHTGKTPGVFRN